jgi:hypothetical protein
MPQTPHAPQARATQPPRIVIADPPLKTYGHHENSPPPDAPLDRATLPPRQPPNATHTPLEH